MMSQIENDDGIAEFTDKSSSLANALLRRRVSQCGPWEPNSTMIIVLSYAPSAAAVWQC